MTLPVRCSCAAAGPGFSIPLIPCKPPVSQSLGSLFLLFSPAVFSPCCEAVCHFFSALYFFRAPLPAARFPRGNPAYFFPLEAKRPSAPCFAPAVLFPFSSIPACPLSYPFRFPFCLSPLALPPFASMPSCPSSLFLFTLPSPARVSAFLPNPGRLLPPPSSPWPFPPVLFFSPILSLPPEKGSKKSPSLTEKASCLRLFPIRPIKKPSQREL